MSSYDELTTGNRPSASMRVIDHRRGLLYGVLAYALWGIVAVYWKALSHVDPVKLLAHRAIWGMLVFAIIVIATHQVQQLRDAFRDMRVVGTMALSASLLAINWGIFVWATIRGRLLEASLGYFINPLVSIALGMVFLRERMRPLQWIAIALAAIGVVLLAWRAHHLPWVALSLAFTFGLYGLVRKTAKVDALIGSTIETVLMVPIAVAYLIATRPGYFFHSDVSTHLLLIGTGAITAVPLVLFTSAARRLPLSTVGFLQYLAPTGQFLLAVLAFGEPVPLERLAAFAVIWTGLAVFTLDLTRRRLRPNTHS
jgi:chloramphenicol-sensitive protein RarD